MSEGPWAAPASRPAPRRTEGAVPTAGAAERVLPAAGGNGAGPVPPGRGGASPPPGRSGRWYQVRRTRSGRRRLPGWVELPLLVVAALVLAVLVKTFLVQAFFIPSGSMEQTLHVGDRVLVNRLSYRMHGIHRGDIVVFNGLGSFDSDVAPSAPANPVVRALSELGQAIGITPAGSKDYIKRVIGLPGDVVACCRHGDVTVNGVPLHETYLYQNDFQPFGPVRVPAGYLWVMGDHRGDSSDSRAHGAVPESRVVGRAFMIVWPPSRWTMLSTPATFDNPLIGERVGHAGHPAPAPIGVAAPAMVGVALPLLRRRWLRPRPAAAR